MFFGEVVCGSQILKDDTTAIWTERIRRLTGNEPSHVKGCAVSNWSQRNLPIAR